MQFGSAQHDFAVCRVLLFQFSSDPANIRYGSRLTSAGWRKSETWATCRYRKGRLKPLAYRALAVQEFQEFSSTPG